MDVCHVFHRVLLQIFRIFLRGSTLAALFIIIFLMYNQDILSGLSTRERYHFGIKVIADKYISGPSSVSKWIVGVLEDLLLTMNGQQLGGTE
jgi:hypothetical protein